MIVQPRGIDKYPVFAGFMDDWFHQDYDIYGDTLEAILPNYVRVTPEADQLSLIGEIDRFKREHGGSEAALQLDFVTIFEPEVRVEGWDGMTTRQWLDRVCALIR